MKNYLFFSLLFMLSLSACDSAYQYDVYVKNSTSEQLRIVFKSPNDLNQPDEQTINLEPGAYQQIISTKNMELGSGNRAVPNQCQLAADYVKAFKGSTPSKIQWCDDKINFDIEDIGEGMYTIDYTLEDF